MAIRIRIARISFVPTNRNTGTVVNKNSPTTKISDVLQTEHQHRIIIDTTNAPNSAGNPTVDNYLRLEAADGYVVKHLDQNMIVTYLSSDL